MYACMHQFEHFAELVIMKTRQAEQLCMFNVYPLCFNSIQKLRSQTNSKKIQLQQQPTFYSVILIKETVT